MIPHTKALSMRESKILMLEIQKFTGKSQTQDGGCDYSQQRVFLTALIFKNTYSKKMTDVIVEKTFCIHLYLIIITSICYDFIVVCTFINKCVGLVVTSLWDISLLLFFVFLLLFFVFCSWEQSKLSVSLYTCISLDTCLIFVVVVVVQLSDLYSTVIAAPSGSAIHATVYTI